MPRKCGLCKKEGHNRTNCENQYYTGEYNYKGERHGKGTYEYKLTKYRKTIWEGAKYEGDWSNGKREGSGSIIFGKPYFGNLFGYASYNGEWKNDKPHGIGTMTYLNKMIYRGEWRECEFIGEKEFPDGSIYKGEINSFGYMRGDGTITFKNGDALKANFRPPAPVNVYTKAVSQAELIELLQTNIYLSSGFSIDNVILFYKNGNIFEGNGYLIPCDKEEESCDKEEESCDKEEETCEEELNKLCWDKSRCGTDIIISKDCKTVKKAIGDSWASLTLKNKLRPGRTVLHFMIDSNIAPYLYIGVYGNGFEMKTTGPPKGNHCWSIQSDGYAYFHNQYSNRRFQGYRSAGDIVTLEIDVSNTLPTTSHIRFLVNNNLIEEIVNIKDELTPIITMGGTKGEQITIGPNSSFSKKMGPSRKNMKEFSREEICHAKKFTQEEKFPINMRCRLLVGKMTYTNGRKFKGTWSQDSVCEGKGYVENITPKGKYYGNYNSQNRSYHHNTSGENGKGKMIYFNGNVYDGEWRQGKKEGEIPRYELIEDRGPDHEKQYTVEVSVAGTILGTGTSTSIKQAEILAALNALKNFKA